MSVESGKNAKGPKVMTSEMKLKIIADFEVGKRDVSVGQELETPPPAIRSVDDKKV
jgi:hypothetical protein